jgi:hypothetical protein
MTGFCKKIATLLFLVALACAVPADCRGFDQPIVAGTQAIPTPAETPAKVIVNGRSSTAQSILIRDLGERIPPTFSADRLKNTEGFTWYVSQHYALKTDFPAERAKHKTNGITIALTSNTALFETHAAPRRRRERSPYDALAPALAARAA